MKFDELCSLAHNVADSFGSGASLLFNYGFYPYDDARRSHDGILEVDFLSGIVISGSPSNELLEQLSLSPRVLADLCVRRGESVNVFASFCTRYIQAATGRRYEVSVTDCTGRSRTDLFDGINGSRLKPGKHPTVVIL